MAMRDRPPFRFDQVGSLLRPAEVREARKQHRNGEISAEALRAVEDESIREAVRRHRALIVAVEETPRPEVVHAPGHEIAAALPTRAKFSCPESFSHPRGGPEVV